jgi:pimeloyl-ACP methyl ester carboxylesterase
MRTAQPILSEHEPRIRVPKDAFLDLPQVRLHYLEWGEPTNPPLLLLHGGSAHAHWWDHIAPVLADDFRVLALDLRGHGDSSWVEGEAAYQIEDYVVDLATFVSLLALPPFVLLGHSLGGFVAMSYASVYAQSLRALVVVDIGLHIGGSRFMQLLRQMPASVYADEADLYTRFRLLPQKTSASAELLRHIARHSIRQCEDGRLTLKCDRATLSREPRDLRAQLPNVHCPVLVLRGGESHNLSPSIQDEMIRLCPRGRGIAIAGAGHQVFLDTPEEFLVKVRSFLLAT